MYIHKLVTSWVHFIFFIILNRKTFFLNLSKLWTSILKKINWCRKIWWAIIWIRAKWNESCLEQIDRWLGTSTRTLSSQVKALKAYFINIQKLIYKWAIIWIKIKWNESRLEQIDRCLGTSTRTLSVHLDKDEKLKLFHYSTYFCYYLYMLHFLALFMKPTVLFQLTLTFIYSTFSNNFSILTK